MAQLDDKTLQNLNKRLEDMDRLLATDYQKAMDLGKAFRQGFTPEQIDAFLKKLNTLSRRDAAKLNVALNLVDVNGRPLTLSEVKRRISQIERAINNSQTSTSIRGTRIVGTTAMTNELQRYKDALSILGMSTSQQFDLIRNGVRRVNKETKGVKSNLENLLPTLRRLAGAFGVAFSVQGLVQFGKKLVETRGEFELQQVALRSILQNKQLADEIWDKTMQAALQSPFTAMQLTKYTKQLAAYRIETEKLFDTTKRLADVSAGLGVDMQRLILAYGQVKAANYLRASEIRQFTEAGVNILGELRDYFNEVKGMSVGTAKVMDMVQKRMVKFEDVEAIFKRMTDEGGIFYNMQYIQSQTIKGQINKLHDAYDQMLNSIGKANEGVLKELISLLLSIIKNWREWKTVLDSILWPVLITSVYKFCKGLSTVGATARLASKNLRGMELAGTRLRKTLVSIYNTLNKLPVKFGGALGIMAAFTSLVALYNHAKAVSAINDAYDEQKRRLRETSRLFEEYKEKVDKNNETIRNRVNIQKEEKDGAEKVAQAQNENVKIVNKLKEDYPEFAAGIKLVRDKQADLGVAINDVNEKLKDQIALLELSKAGTFYDDLKTNAEEYQSSVLEQENQVEINLDYARDVYQDYLDWKKEKEREYREEYANDEKKLRKKLNELNKVEPPEWVTDILNAGKNAEKQINALKNKFIDYSEGEYVSWWRGVELSEKIKLPEGATGGFYGVGEKTLKEREEDLRNNLKKWAPRVRIIFQQQLEKLANDTINDVREYVKKNGTIVDNWFEYGTGTGWKAINESIVNTATRLGISLEQSRKIVEDEINKVLYNSYGKKIKLDWSNKPTTESGDTETQEEKQAKIDADWRRRIGLIEEMKKRYDELSKSAYGYAKSEETVRNAFNDSFKEIFKDTGISMKQIDFTSMAGMMNSLKLALSNARGVSDAVREEIMKKIDSYETQITINANVRIREDFGRQMEEAFGNYELTLDLQKLNLPSDVLSDLFDIEDVGLSDLRTMLSNYYKDRIADNTDPEKLYEQLEGYYKKIDELERKQQRERIKDYAKYLEYELSERAKMEMEYVRKIAEVEAESAFSADKKKEIQRRLKKEYEEKIAKQEWEDFKGSEMYVQMMEDLEHQGLESLQIMRQELERIRDNAENLSPRALKEVIGAIEKINEIEVQRRGPIGSVLKSRDNLQNAWLGLAGVGINIDEVKTQKQARDLQANLQKQIAETEIDINQLKEKIGAEETLDRLEKDRYNNLLKIEEEFGETFVNEDDAKIYERIREIETDIKNNRNKIAEYTKETEGADEKTNKQLGLQTQASLENINCLQTQKELLEKEIGLRLAIAQAKLSAPDLSDSERDALKKQIEELEAELKLLRNQESAVNSVTDAWDKLWKNGANAIQKMAGWLQDIYSSTKGLAEAYGADTSSGIFAYGDAVNTTVGAIGNVASQLASGNTIGAIVSAVTGIMDSIASFAGASDAELEARIKEEQKRIETLQRAYERLEKQIERTYDTFDYMDTYNQQVANLRSQIDALAKQRAAEEDKKNTDKDKVQGYSDAIEGAYNKLEELQQKQIEVFGGIGKDNYRSWAEGFVDAWKSAFLETGDGLDALQDHFDEFLQEWFVKQATMRIAGKALEGVMGDIDNVVSDDGIVDWNELQAIRSRMASILPDLNDKLTQFAGMFDLSDTGSLSGLAAGIQGMTEEQANILEAYWNSVRMYTASIDMNVSRIAEMLGAGGPNTNPMLTELETIASHTSFIPQIYTLLTGTRRNLGNGQGFVTYNQ